MKGSLVTVNVDIPCFLHLFQQLLLFVVVLATNLECLNEGGDLAAVFRPTGQQFVNLLFPLHQENLHGDLAVLTGITQAVLPLLQFERELPAVFEGWLRWSHGCSAYGLRQRARSNEAACRAVFNLRGRVALRLSLSVHNFDLGSHLLPPNLTSRRGGNRPLALA